MTVPDQERHTTSIHYEPSAHYEVHTRDVEYRNDGSRKWLARIYEPQGTGPFPALLDVHGGGWRLNDRLQDEPYVTELATHGLFVISPDFHPSTDAPYPASMRDINYATRWLKASASEFNASPQGIGAAGFSSGGHLVMLSAMRPLDSRYTSHPLNPATNVDATLAYVIVGWPVIDPYGRHLYALEIGNEDLADFQTRYFIDEATMKDASPLLILERGEKVATPPTLLLQGSADMTHPRILAARFVDAYCNAGGLIETGWYPGAGSMFLKDPSENTRRAMAQVKGFIARQLEDLDARP